MCVSVCVGMSVHTCPYAHNVLFLIKNEVFLHTLIKIHRNFKNKDAFFMAGITCYRRGNKEVEEGRQSCYTFAIDRMVVSFLNSYVET